MKQMEHLKIRQADISRYVILTGNPDRVVKIAQRLQNPQKIAQNREFVTCTGFLDDVKITVTSTGIGSPSAAIAIEELSDLGADTFIRVGTSGSLQKEVQVGDLIVASAAVRDEGTSVQYVPLFYPAIAHYEVIQALQETATHLKIPVKIGVVHTKDSYRQEIPAGIPLENAIQEKWRILQRANVLCTEMEASALFVVGSLKKVRTGAVIVAAGLTYQGVPDINTQDTSDGIDQAIDLALRALTMIAQKDQNRDIGKEGE